MSSKRYKSALRLLTVIFLTFLMSVAIVEILMPGAPLLALFEKWASGPRSLSRFCSTLFHHHWIVCAVTAPMALRGYPLVMGRKLKRYYGAGHLHFITCSCYRRQALLGTVRRRDLFLSVLEQVRRRYRFVVAGYVVMPEHIHLLIGEPQLKTPSTVMQALKLSSARRVLASAKRRRHPGQASLFDHAPQHLWQKRFYDFNVWTENKRIEKLRPASRSSAARTGDISGTVALEQFPRLRPRRNWAGTSERMGSPQNEDSTTSGVDRDSPVSAVRRPTSRKAREVGHPRFLLCQRSQQGYTPP